MKLDKAIEEIYNETVSIIDTSTPRIDRIRIYIQKYIEKNQEKPKKK